MVKVLKRIGMGLVGLLVLGIVLVSVISTIRWNQGYENFDIPVESISIPTDEAAIARGEHIAITRFCGSCHGDNLAGGYLMNELVLAVIPAPNLTAGTGGVGLTNTDEDWIRAIRHGVGHDNRGLIGMPARIWYQLIDEDLGALIAYLKNIPSVDNEFPKRKIGPAFRLMLTLGLAPVSEAPLIDHSASRPSAPQPGVTLEYGEYLALGCTACHGPTMNGGTIRDLNGELVTALNLTPGGELQGWSEEDFITAIRTGETPSGHVMSEIMPWRYVGQMTDKELQAIWLYIQSLPALEQGTERTDL
jgi:mono/diheme cytochrome c family protein